MSDDETRLVNAIGYEGVSFEQFVACLRDYEVELVLDVRANPCSRKPGFSRKPLEGRLADCGIRYRHFGALGLPSSVRSRFSDVNALLDYWDAHIPWSSEGQAAVREVAKLCREYNAAVMCFEADPLQCHRSRLVRYLEREHGLTGRFLASSAERVGDD